MYFVLLSRQETDWIILRVYTEHDDQRYIEVPVTPDSTCQDVLECVREPGETHCHLVEVWRETERPLAEHERPYHILQQWGPQREEVSFHLRIGPQNDVSEWDHELYMAHDNLNTPTNLYAIDNQNVPDNLNGVRRQRARNGFWDTSSGPEGLLPGGSELSLAELQDMASRQQQQIDNQQQVLVAKEQRLKYLKQQELKHQQISAENERLRKLKEKVETQEMKLKKLRALRGQVEQYKLNNGNLNSELEGIKSLFNEKEKELAMAVAKVDELTTQLESLRSGKASMNMNKENGSLSSLELEKLRKELILRNKLNEQQNAKITAHREILHARKDDISQMDRRIGDLQQRLKKKKAQQVIGQNYTLNNNNNNFVPSNLKSNNRNGGTNIAAVEPYIKHSPKDITKDDLHTSYSFERQDPKNQTLPPNLKFPQPEKGKILENNNIDHKANTHVNGPYRKSNDYNVPLVVKVDNKSQPNGVQQSSDPKSTGPSRSSDHNNQSSQDHLKGHKLPVSGQRAGLSISHFTPKPFGSTYSTSMLTGRPFVPSSTQAPQPFTNAQDEIRTGGSGQSSPATSDNSYPVTSSGQVATLSQPHSTAPLRDGYGNGFPPKPVYSMAKLNHVGPTPSGLYNSQPSVSAPARDAKPPTTAVSKNDNGPHPIMSARVPERGPVIPPRESSAGSTANTNTFVSSNKHPMQTPLSRPSHRVSTTPPSMTSGGNTIVSDSISTSKVGPWSPSQVPPNSGNKPGPPHLGPQSMALSSRWPRPGPESSTAGASSGTNAPARGKGYPANGNVSVSGNQNNTHGQNGNGSPPLRPETTQASVTSALNALLQPGPAGQNLKAAPRYASKSVIANTYTRKLGSGAMEQYRKNMSMLYQGFGEKPQQKPEEQAKGNQKPEETAKSAAIKPAQEKSVDFSKQGLDITDSSRPVPSSPDQAQVVVSKSVPPSTTHSTSTSNLSQYASDKPSYKVMSPKHLRRRHSDSSDSEDIQSKLPQKRTDTPAESSLMVPQDNTTNTKPESIHIPDGLVIDNLGNVLEVSDGTDLSVTSAQNEVFGQPGEEPTTPKAPIVIETNKVKRRLKTNLKSKSYSAKSSFRRVSFDPLALLLDASLEGELELVRKTAKEVSDVSASNDEGITALHNAICAGHYEIVKFLVEFGSDANAPDSDGWTPLHCAASCNNLPMVKLLVEHGACIFATTISDHETAAEKCEEDEDGYDGCSEYLYSIQEKLGIINNGVVYAVFDYKSQNSDELSFRVNSQITVLRKGDDKEKEWWWSRIRDREGYVPKNLLGLSRRVIPDRGKAAS